MAKVIMEFEVENLEDFYMGLDRNVDIIDYTVIREIESSYTAYILVDNDIHDDAIFDTYEEAERWCDMVYTEIEEYECDDEIQYIAYILVGGNIHDSAEFNTKEEAEKWCNAVTTEIEEVAEE